MKSIKRHPKLTESRPQLIEVKGPVKGWGSSILWLLYYLCAQRGLIPTTATTESLLRQSLLWKQQWEFYHGLTVSGMVRLSSGLVVAVCIYILLQP